MAAMAGGRPEGLPQMIGGEERGAAGPAVDESGLDRLSQVGLGRHVDDGVVDEDGVEPAPEPHGPQVALEVLAEADESAHPGRAAVHAPERPDRPHPRRGARPPFPWPWRFWPPGTSGE